jgi:hypothetical protein
MPDVVSHHMCQLMGKGPSGVLIMTLNNPKTPSPRWVGRSTGDGSITSVPAIDPSDIVTDDIASQIPAQAEQLGFFRAYRVTFFVGKEVVLIEEV